jgi:HSP20 family protein
MLFRCDVYEDDGELVVEVEAPGVPAEKLALSVGEGVLCVEAARPPAWRTVRWHRRERAEGASRREIPLPEPVLFQRAEAELRDGLLRVRLPLARRRGLERIGVPLERESVSARRTLGASPD